MQNQSIKPIAIHDNGLGFTPRWIEYCTINKVPFILVNCYETNIIETLKNCSGLMWHWNYDNYRDSLFACQLLLTVKELGLEIFPDFWTTLLFDDKVGQKYLFEFLDIPAPKTHVFYDKKDALEWSRNTEYPVVFKLRSGASGQNVRLVKSFSQAKALISKSFSSGFKHNSKKQILMDRFLKFMHNRDANAFRNLLQCIYRIIIPKYGEKFLKKEIGYVLFQEFIPDNSYDTRLVIIGNRCFGAIRHNRKNDFRASGSGITDYSHNKIDKRPIKFAFEIAGKLGTRAIYLDFINDKNSNPLLMEVCFASYVYPYDNCEGYWDSELVWHEGQQNLQYLMLEDFWESIKNKSREKQNS
jgi:glutathione synthase/RimK-type ligase-like ATP-grasp enzyme